MEPAQLSFLETLAPEPPKPPYPWELLAAGLAANEMTPFTREDVRRMKENQRKP
ncbi:hypothetical protein [Rhizobium sp. Rhizsp82]|uniref:hypothetical protein n=1 Tax=Rhizobium sp. Rhizsp82 TaxID=3243057 RepID=UPI0039B619F5